MSTENSSRSVEIMKGFKLYTHFILYFCKFCFNIILANFLNRNWMNLRDADSGRILWQSNEDL